MSLINDCAGDPITFYCDPCLQPYGGRIRQALLIKKGTTFTDKTDPAEWTALIASGDIFVLPETRGSKPVSSVVTADGFGDTITINSGREHTATISFLFDPQNRDAVNALNSLKNWEMVFRLDTGLTIWTDAPVNASADFDVPEAITDPIVYQVDVSWSNKNIMTVETGVPEEAFACAEPPTP
jgi:hypothetical protein